MAEETKTEETKAPTKRKAKVKRAQFRVNYYESGVAKYAAGQHYPITTQTASQIAAGNAEEVTIDMDAEEHAEEEAAATAALNVSYRATIAAESEARKRGELK